MTEHADVLEFRQRFGHPVSERPTRLTQRRLAERANAMLDELKEFAFAGGLALRDGEFIIVEEGKQDLAEQADGLVDLVYFALGTAVMQGLPWVALWNDVHNANMRKVPGPTGDVIKPPGWKGPKGKEILAAHNYDPEAPCIDDPEHSR